MATEKSDERGLVVNDRFRDRDLRAGVRVVRVVELAIDGKRFSSADRVLALRAKVLCENDFWGWGPNRDGKNTLGKLWMEIRDEVRGEAAR